jgi:hypothetical protein
MGLSAHHEGEKRARLDARTRSGPAPAQPPNKLGRPDEGVFSGEASDAAKSRVVGDGRSHGDIAIWPEVCDGIFYMEEMRPPRAKDP